MSDFRPRRLGRAIAITLAALLMAAQFVPVQLENPRVSEWVEAPREIRAAIERSCVDCHSYETQWPWYSHIAPASWLVAHDVREGRYALNFSAWDEYDEDEKIDLLERVGEEVRANRMPPWYYVALHPEASTDEEMIELLMSWSRAIASDDLASTTSSDQLP
jgi:hypothetical protein